MRIVSGRFKGRTLKAPGDAALRPTSDKVRQAIFNILEHAGFAAGFSLEGARVVDLFAGTGALGLEALSRGAAHATFVEIARQSLASLGDNLRTLDAEARATVVKGDALKYALRLGPRAFDVALADPPYGQGHAAALLERFAQVPFARELWVEHRTGEAVPELPGLRQRRYGDTTISSVAAAAADADTSSEDA